MIPIHFGHRDRLLLGIYTPAATPRKRRGALILNPWGIEAMRAHRAMKQLSDFLARSGIDTFRFDYFGTGDSFGDGADVTLAGCLDDAEAAIDELLGAAAVSKVTVIGLRLGAILAGQLAARRLRDIDQVVFWDPVLSGQAYLEELCSRRKLGEAELSNYRGFEISPTFRDEIKQASCSGLPGNRARTLLACSRANVEPQSFGLQANKLDVIGVDSLNCWEEERDFGAGAVPVELLKRISEWVN